MATIQTVAINLDLTPGNTLPVIHLSKGDYNTRMLRFYLYSNQQKYTIPDDVTGINIEGCTANGGVYSYACTYNASGSYASKTVTQTMTAAAGMSMCELVLLTDNGRLGTANFIIFVEESSMANAHVSESDLASITASLTLAQAQAILSKSWAVGGTGSRSGENTNNSKYWSEQASAKVATVDDRLDTIISGVTQPNTEILDARTGFTGVTYDTLGRAIRQQAQDLNAQIMAVTSVNNIAPDWSVSVQYHDSDLVLKDSDLYRCRASDATLGTWVASEWQKIKISTIYPELVRVFAPAYVPGGSYSQGSVCTYHGKIFEAQAETSASSFDTSVWTQHSLAHWITKLNTAISDLLTLTADFETLHINVEGNFANDYNSAYTYYEGDIVLRDDRLYVCIVDTATVGAFVPEEWDTTSVAAVKEYAKQTKIKQTNLIRALAPEYQTGVRYAVNDIVWYDRMSAFFRCTVAHTSETEAPASGYWSRKPLVALLKEIYA